MGSRRLGCIFGIQPIAAWFENLLPDSKSVRQRVARRFQTGSVEPFDLLAQVGRDCVGALQILPRGDAPQGVTTLESEPLSDAQVAEILRGAITPGPLGLGHDVDDFRISIAGGQEKTALLGIDGQWDLPQGTTPSTHILKLLLGLAGGMRLDLSLQDEARSLVEFAPMRAPDGTTPHVT